MGAWPRRPKRCVLCRHGEKGVTIEWSTSWTNLTTLNLSYVHGVFQGLTEFIFRCMRQQSQSFCNLDSHFLLTKLGSIVHSVLLFLLPYAACFHCRHDAVASLQQAESKFANLVRNSWKHISSVGHSVFDMEQIEAASLWRRGILGQRSRCGWIIWSGQGSCNEENFCS